MGTRTLIKGGHVVTMDSQLGTLDRGDVLLSDERIEAVGRDLQAPDATVVDATNRVVIPGLIDTHRHTWQTQMRAVCADMSISGYMNALRMAISPNYTADDVYVGNLVGALEAVDAGVTTVLDFSHCNNSPGHADGAIGGLLDSGIRAVFAYGFFDSAPPEVGYADHAERVKDYHRLVREHSNQSLVRVGVSVNELGFVPFEQTRAEIDAAREEGEIVAFHTACFFGTPLSNGIKDLHAAGLLGPDQVHIHCAALDEQEWAHLGEAGCKVSIAVETEMNMGMGWPVMAECRRRNIKPTLSCDIISLNSGSLVPQMRLAIAADRFAQNDPINRAGQMPESLQTSVHDVLGWATINGAEACGLGAVTGSLTPGKKGDVVIVGNLRTFTGQPSIDPVGGVILQSTPQDVQDVWINGTHVKKNGELVGVDLPALFARSKASTDEILRKVYRDFPVLPPQVEGSRFSEREKAAQDNIKVGGAS